MAARAASVRWALAWRPEWPFEVLIGVAWTLMAGGSIAERAGRSANGFACSIALAPGTGAITLAGVPGWPVMSIGMMLPVTLPWLRYVALNSTVRRRLLAMLLYVAAFMAVWVALGALELGAAGAAGAIAPRPVVLSLGLLVAGAWEFSALKRVTLVRCHWTVALPPAGRRANMACLRFGARRGMACAVNCWALMLVMALVGVTQVALMVVVTAVAVGQKRTVAGWRLLPASGSVLIAASLVVLVA
jgi:predicted metal-binding membrane protein